VPTVSHKPHPIGGGSQHKYKDQKERMPCSRWRIRRSRLATPNPQCDQRSKRWGDCLRNREQEHDYGAVDDVDPQQPISPPGNLRWAPSRWQTAQK